MKLLIYQVKKGCIIQKFDFFRHKEDCKRWSAITKQPAQQSSFLLIRIILKNITIIGFF